jgi:hypothetical protein
MAQTVFCAGATGDQVGPRLRAQRPKHLLLLISYLSSSALACSVGKRSTCETSGQAADHEVLAPRDFMASCGP